MIDINKSQIYIAANRAETISNLTNFLLTDTLLFWSNEEKLRKTQEKVWQPLLNIVQTEYGLHLNKTTDINPAENNESQRKFIKILQNLSDKELTICFLAASESKSSLLGILFTEGKISSSELFSAAFLEEIYQSEMWGKDVAAENKRQQVKKIFLQLGDYRDS